jgi:hypothetical protein
MCEFLLEYYTVEKLADFSRGWCHMRGKCSDIVGVLGESEVLQPIGELGKATMTSHTLNVTIARDQNW